MEMPIRRLDSTGSGQGTGDGVQVVIKNQDSAPVNDEFWVDVYINPSPAPTTANQIWPDMAGEGLVWDVTAAALPLAPGDMLTLTVGDIYYVPEYSQVAWPLAEGTPVHAHTHVHTSGPTCAPVRARRSPDPTAHPVQPGLAGDRYPLA